MKFENTNQTENLCFHLLKSWKWIFLQHRLQARAAWHSLKMVLFDSESKHRLMLAKLRFLKNITLLRAADQE